MSLASALFFGLSVPPLGCLTGREKFLTLLRGIEFAWVAGSTLTCIFLGLCWVSRCSVVKTVVGQWCNLSVGRVSSLGIFAVYIMSKYMVSM